MSAPICDRLGCDRPTSGAMLCTRCAERTLPIALANIAAYYADLDVMRARLHAVRYDQAGGGKGGRKDLPLPVDARFADTANRSWLDEDGKQHVGGAGTAIAWEARNTLTTWARAVLEEWPPITAPVCVDPLCRRCNPLRAEAQLRRPPADSVPAICVYLVRMSRHITSATWASVLLDELLDLERRLRRFVDVPPSRWYAGPCTAGQSNLTFTALCGADLYAVLDRDEVTCSECEATYSITERRAWLLAAADDRLEPASAIARAVKVLGDYPHPESWLAQRIRQWSARKQLEVRGSIKLAGRLRPTYRIGDVLDLVADDTRESQLRKVQNR